jgi:methyl-accepting chemotaxis protein
MVDEIAGQHEAAVNTEESFRRIKDSSAGIDSSSKMLSEIVDQLAQANREIVDSISTISAISEEVSAHASDTYEISEQNIQTVGEVVSISDELKDLTAKLNA